jgi:hypothetical protein
MGNPVVKLIKYYRKTVIAALPDLRYLDDRPVGWSCSSFALTFASACSMAKLPRKLRGKALIRGVALLARSRDGLSPR